MASIKQNRRGGRENVAVSAKLGIERAILTQTRVGKDRKRARQKASKTATDKNVGPLQNRCYFKQSISVHAYFQERYNSTTNDSLNAMTDAERAKSLLLGRVYRPCDNLIMWLVLRLLGMPSQPPYAHARLPRPYSQTAIISRSLRRSFTSPRRGEWNKCSCRRVL